MSINRACLVLNASYEPLHIAAARRALTLMAKDVVVVVEEDDTLEVYPGIFLPLVVRLRNPIHVPYRLTVLTRKNILTRDRNSCQYCGKKVNPRELTLDHIMPESRGGKYSWDNLVACCSPCNRKKSNQTPEEAGMVLLHRPRPSTLHTSRYMLRMIGMEEDKRWEKYIFA